MKLGFMQGRLVEPKVSEIQEFPIDDWEREINLARRINIRLIEWVIDKNSLNINPIYTSAQHVKGLLKSCEVDLESISDDFFLQEDRSEIINNNISDHLELSFNTAVDIGVKLYILPLLEKTSLKEFNSTERVNILKKIEKLVPPNLKICLETDLDHKKLNDLFSEIDTRKFKINYDIGNSGYEGFNYLDEFDNYFELIENIHIKDRLFKGISVPLGKGDAKVFQVLEEIKLRGYKNNLILQAARQHGVNDLEVVNDYYKSVKETLEI